MKAAFDVAIIGAGFAGLTAAARLKKRTQTSFVIFERANQVGGTWRQNSYPGCACDIPSHLYSLSFAMNPNWSRMYSTQPEILAYTNQIVDQYDLNAHIRYNTDIVRVVFSDAHWHLTDRTGNQTTARTVILAVGPLNYPSIPKLPGLQTFAGTTFHSSNWNTHYELTGKRVAVVGTGASAIQFIPKIAPLVKQLTIFQRTAPYVSPRRDRAISAVEQHLFRKLPIAQKAYRSLIYWYNELQGMAFLGNEGFNKIGTKRALKHLNQSIKDPELRQKVTPTYKLGCKRVLISDDYYPALNRNNVDLITAGITEVTANSIIDADGHEHSVDAIIFGTGFVVGGAIANLNITGRYGQNLFEHWLTKGAEAYYGIAMSGYPNMLFMVGPNTGLGHNSILHMIESQVNYALSYLDLLEKKPADAYLDVKPEVQQQYNSQIQQKMQNTVWASGCQSYYLDSKGRNTTIWPGLSSTYRKATQCINPADYELVCRNRPKPEAVFQPDLIQPGSNH
ncbi:NAD(P)/FAD-dependent oxidoreductase [Spirosoma sp. SC4-14]|uniref:flavin-containing monooxygenase n=1 Tax=Spirosoma sp. SC4-14 TaxID=3128900 RepID=UPI0030CCE0B3